MIAERLSLLLFHPSHRRKIASSRSAVRARPSASGSAINEAQESRIAAMPLDILCFLGDREEMAHSLEARLPFLDHKLYDVAKFIPVDFKVRDGLEKAVLRDAAKDILPEDLRLRRKRGFMMTSEPIDFFGADRPAMEKMRTYLSKEAFERARIFSYSTYRAISLLARVPASIGPLRRLRRNANMALMYMVEVHMLHCMFVEDPRWLRPTPGTANPRTTPAFASELVV